MIWFWLFVGMTILAFAELVLWLRARKQNWLLQVLCLDDSSPRLRLWPTKNREFLLAVFDTSNAMERRKNLETKQTMAPVLHRLKPAFDCRCRQSRLRFQSASYSGRLIYVFFLSSRQKQAQERVRTTCHGLLDQATDQGFRLVCGLSNVVREPKELVQQYDELLRDLEKKLFVGQGPALFYHQQQDLKDKPPLDASSKRMERGLFLCLVNNDFDGAEAELRSLMAAVGEGDYVDIRVFKMKLFSCLELSAYLLGFKLGKENLLADAAPDLMGDIDQCSTALRLESVALSFIGLLRTQFLVNIGSAGPGADYIQAAQRLAQEGYTNPELNTTGIANLLGVNLSQMSRAFKQAKNINLSEYIQGLRLAEAKRLLRETDQSVEAVAERAGFANAKAMYRAFEKKEGMTPSNYRRGTGIIEGGQ